MLREVQESGSSGSTVNYPVSPTMTTTYYAESEATVNGTITFAYTGAVQSWVVPANITSLGVDVQGAQGGTYYTSNGNGGFGGRVQASLSVTPMQQLYFYIGQQGSYYTTSSAPASFNGGGIGAWSYYYGGNGGGGSDIRTASGAYNTVLVVAGGGGGGQGYTGYTGGDGGAGGGLTGGNGLYSGSYNSSYSGAGGSQSAGGIGGSSYGGTGLAGVGGNAYYYYGGAGGGGGYFGGGGGYEYGGGGGGSSWTGSACSNVTHTQGYTNGNGQIIVSYNNTLCTSPSRVPVTVTVIAPQSPAVTANPSLVCSGQSTNLTGTCSIGKINWWDSPTGGNLLGSSLSGAIYVFAPTTTTVYYAETYATCGTSVRTADSIFVGTLASPANVTATPSFYNCGSGNVVLNGTTYGQNIGWYDAASAGNLLGNTASGTNLIVYPAASTTYYAESQNFAYGSQTFVYTGSLQTFTVPSLINSISVDVYGAQGGTFSAPAGVGGLGGRVKATMSVTPGQSLNLFVGQAGTWNTSSPYGAGYNGGGSGSYSSYYGGGGGGASDIRIGSTDLSMRIIVAAGGGGANGYTGYNNGNGGAGGDQIGGYGLYYGSYYSSYCGMGGTQTGGGAGAPSGGTAGTLGYGGAAYSSYGGGGGGGGYYGGGGGFEYSGGGGGSNFVSTNSGLTNVVTYGGYNTGNGQIIVSWNTVFCTSPSRTPVSVTVNSISTIPSNVAATPSSITCSNTSTLSATATGYSVGWFTNPTGGTPLGTGTTYTVSPTTTTIYYAEAETFSAGALTFSYTGAVQSWIVPGSTVNLTVDVRAAQGGTFSSTYGLGGNGGRVQSNIAVTPGQTLYFYVGQMGTYYTSPSASLSFNGGGIGAWSTYYGGCGGGASDIRTASGSESSALIIAGGGGGGQGYSGYSSGNGGAGGGLTAGNGWYSGSYSSSYAGAGGSQTGGGIGGGSYGGPGMYGIGGNAYYYYGGGGGGGGYYGGGGGYEYGGGGGGSSWTSSLCSNVTHTQGFTTGNGQILISWSSVQCASGSRTPVTLTVNPPLTPVTYSQTIACGQSGNLNATTTLGTVRWWDSPSGGNYLGTSQSGVNFVVQPSVTTIYYAEAYTTCPSTRAGDTITIGNLPLPTSVYASPTSLNCGGNDTLNATSSNTIGWFNVPFGGTRLGTGSQFIFTPPAGGNYYAEGEILIPTPLAASNTFNYTGSISTWTIPSGVTTLTITAAGASGGTYSSIGGRGAIMTGTFNVTPGNVLSLLVGQCPGSTTLYAAGGGGTFVALGSNYATATPLIVGGGGGGGYSSAGVDAPTSQAGTYTTTSYLGANGYGALAAPCVGGGGGFYSSGGADTYYTFPGGGGFQQGGSRCMCPVILR